MPKSLIIWKHLCLISKQVAWECWSYNTLPCTATRIISRILWKGKAFLLLRWNRSERYCQSLKSTHFFRTTSIFLQTTQEIICSFFHNVINSIIKTILLFAYCYTSTFFTFPLRVLTTSFPDAHPGDADTIVEAWQDEDRVYHLKATEWVSGEFHLVCPLWKRLEFYFYLLFPARPRHCRSRS